jgi:hypothetical protein
MKTSKASSATTLAKIYIKNRMLLQGLALCAALGITLPGMAQPLQQGSGQAISSFTTPRETGQAFPTVDVYKSPQCGCCKSWAEHLQKNGFTVILHDVDDVPAARKKLGMPNRFGSCHTAKIGQYLVEGHVPAADIKKLLKKNPKAIGLAVPAMPPGSPGMESEHPIPYDTLLIGVNGNAKVFAHH